jgi:hypothetical protein
MTKLLVVKEKPYQIMIIRHKEIPTGVQSAKFESIVGEK